MPRKAANYQNTVIYKIVCNDLTIKDCYVGHTTDFSNRKSSHKKACNNEHDGCHCYAVYRFIRAHGGWNNWTMVELEKFPCNDSNEAAARERFQYEQIGANLNGNVPNRSKAEYGELYYVQNKDLILEKKRKYLEQNRDLVLEKKRINYEQNKALILEKQRQYYEDNKDFVLEQQRQYLEQNRDRINARRRELRAIKKLAAAAADTP